LTAPPATLPPAMRCAPAPPPTPSGSRRRRATFSNPAPQL